MNRGGRGGKDVWSGALFVAIGALAVIAVQEHAMGTAMRMGPAYFPTVLGGLLAALGAVMIAQGLLRDGDPIGRLPLRPMLLLPLAILAFALLIRPVGLVGATMALVVLGALGGWEFRLREALPLSLGLAALVVLIFVYGFGFPFRLWPAF